MNTVEMAKLLRASGFSLCKIDDEEKSPSYSGWSTSSREPGHFNPGQSIGILGGPLSDGGKPGHATVILDLDTPEVNARADEYLPVTGMMDGRASKPRSHRYILVPVETIPPWGLSTAEQGAKAANEKTGNPGPFTKSFRHRETNAEVFKFCGTGAQCVCPPSIHSSGEVREWEGGTPGEPAIVGFLELWQACCELASACGCIIPDVVPRPSQRRIRAGRKSVLERALKYLAEIPGAVSQAGGHKQTFDTARRMVYGFDLGAEVGFQILRDHYNPRCSPAWSERELRHKCDDADRVPYDKPRGWLRDAQRNGHIKPSTNGHVFSVGTGEVHDTPTDPHFDDTDIANGRQFVNDHGEDVRYVADWGKWVVYDGKRWQIDRSETLVERLAKETANRMAEEADERVREIQADQPDEEGEDAATAKLKYKAALKNALAALAHAKATADMRSIRRMLQAARSEPDVCIPDGGKVFDIRRDLLNCPNGTVELRTATLREHRRDDYITRLCPTKYDPDAPREVYFRFLQSTFSGKPEVAQYVRDLSGCVVTGEVSDQALYISHGEGSNGKNVLFDAWKSVLGEGEYAHSAAAELLVGDGWDRHPTEKTGLRGARLVVCSETGEDGQLDETKMKALTGGDTIVARYMRQDFFQFEPTHKLILLTNNKPRVRGTDHGIWRRIRLVPFKVKFWKPADKELNPTGDYREEFKADPTLGERLRTIETPGILADMVEHAVAFYRNGGTLQPPADVLNETAEYRKAEDTIGQYFDARVKADDAGKVKASEFYKAFKMWWEGEGFPPNKVPSPTRFGREAKRRFVTDKPHGVTYRIEFLPEPESQNGDTPKSDSSEGPRVSTLPGLSIHGTRARAPDVHPEKASNPRNPRTAPDAFAELVNAEDPADAFEREAIREYGGG